MAKSYKIEQSGIPYLKAILHAFKYPTQSVNGVLLGTKNDSVIEIKEAVPLLHTRLSLLPLLEVALMQINNFDLSIVGYYYANERADDNSFGSTHQSIAEKIHAQFPGAIVWQIDNSKLTDKENLALKVYIKQKKWTEEDIDILKVDNPEKLIEKCTTLLKQGVQHKIVDFESHCNDISKDWRNLDLIK